MVLAGRRGAQLGNSTTATGGRCRSRLRCRYRRRGSSLAVWGSIDTKACRHRRTLAQEQRSRYPCPMDIGDRVRCQREAPAKGTWSRYDGREGTIVSINRQTFPSGKFHVEYGVSFTIDPQATTKRVADDRAEAWFLPSELVPAAP